MAARHAYGWAERSGTRRELPLSFQATDSSQKVAAGGEDRCDGPPVPGQKLREHERDGKKATDKHDGDHEKYDNDKLAAHHRIAWSFEVTAPLWEITQTLSAH